MLDDEERVETFAENIWKQRLIHHDIAGIAARYGFTATEIDWMEWDVLPETIRDHIRDAARPTVEQVITREMHMDHWQPFLREPMPDASGWLFHNNRYHVIVRRVRNPLPSPDGGPDIVHLSIRDEQRTARHDWRDFQRIKNEILGPETELVEVYPRESQLVDTSNQFHLWGFLSEKPVFTEMGLCWEQGRVVWDGVGPRPVVPGHDVSNSVQRPMMEPL